jgi:hypothetical protein
MHTGALMAARQALGQYLVYARPWQRALVAAGLIGGGALLIAVGLVTGHVIMAIVGGLVLVATGNACVRVIRARRRGGQPPG